MQRASARASGDSCAGAAGLEAAVVRARVRTAPDVQRLVAHDRHHPREGRRQMHLVAGRRMPDRHEGVAHGLLRQVVPVQRAQRKTEQLRGRGVVQCAKRLPVLHGHGGKQAVQLIVLVGVLHRGYPVVSLMQTF
jgi:hypothetical protein